MCGIFGFATSSGHESSVVIEGLKELEYRGYDSWGVAMARDGSVGTEKQVGKIGDVLLLCSPPERPVSDIRGGRRMGASLRRTRTPTLTAPAGLP